MLVLSICFNTLVVTYFNIYRAIRAALLGLSGTAVLQTLNAPNLADPQIHRLRVLDYLLLYTHPATLAAVCIGFCLDLVQIASSLNIQYNQIVKLYSI